jgi:hypothetical protein
VLTALAQRAAERVSPPGSGSSDLAVS